MCNNKLTGQPEALRIDTGGALLFWAEGISKGKNFQVGKVINNKQAFKIFKNIDHH